MNNISYNILHYVRLLFPIHITFIISNVGKYEHSSLKVIFYVIFHINIIWNQHFFSHAAYLFRQNFWNLICTILKINLTKYGIAEKEGENCQVENSCGMWVRFFSTCRACVRLFEVARYRASKLASGRNHITVDESPTGLSVSGLFRLIFYCSLPSFRRPPACTRSAARSDDALKLKTLEMGHSRYLSLFLFLSLCLSPFLSSSFSIFFPCSVLRRMP